MTTTTNDTTFDLTPLLASFHALFEQSMRSDGGGDFCNQWTMLPGDKQEALEQALANLVRKYRSGGYTAMPTARDLGREFWDDARGRVRFTHTYGSFAYDLVGEWLLAHRADIDRLAPLTDTPAPAATVARTNGQKQSGWRNGEFVLVNGGDNVYVAGQTGANPVRFTSWHRIGSWFDYGHEVTLVAPGETVLLDGQPVTYDSEATGDPDVFVRHPDGRTERVFRGRITRQTVEPVAEPRPTYLNNTRQHAWDSQGRLLYHGSGARRTDEDIQFHWPEGPSSDTPQWRDAFYTQEQVDALDFAYVGEPMDTVNGERVVYQGVHRTRASVALTDRGDRYIRELRRVQNLNPVTPLNVPGWNYDTRSGSVVYVDGTEDVDAILYGGATLPLVYLRPLTPETPLEMTVEDSASSGFHIGERGTFHGPRGNQSVRADKTEFYFRGTTRGQDGSWYVRAADTRVVLAQAVGVDPAPKVDPVLVVDGVEYLRKDVVDRDLQTMTSILHARSVSNGLCPVYDRTQREVDEATEYLKMGSRYSTYRVTVEQTITVRRTFEVTNQADETAARSAASDQAVAYALSVVEPRIEGESVRVYRRGEAAITTIEPVTG